MRKRGWILMIACIFGTFCLVFFFLPSTRIPRAYTNQDFAIKEVHSPIDKDNDGLEDYQDFLQGARAYIQTRPRYKSRYYASAYPNDGYGVCTDVIAQSFLHAGYDLSRLVHQDRKRYPKEYANEKMDPNIDFRRVRNLKVYFSHHSVSLTKNVKEIDQWQKGDIVIFRDHIGMISNYRNKKGIPYVIHHGGSFQWAYEQDILEMRKDIEAHYRFISDS